MSFKSGFQGGPYFELLSTQGRDFMINWKESSSGIKKTYEKDVKGFVFTLEGSPATTKLMSPKDQKQSLTLIQRFLVLQLYIPKGGDFCVELGITDMGNNKRRMLLSTAQKETQVTPLHAKFPLAIVRRAVWLNLVVDMVSFVGETWTNQTFRCLDQISVSANCKLRRVFTMRSQPPDSTDDDELYGCSNTNDIKNGELESIPKQCQMTSSVVQQTQVLTLNKIRCAERLKSAKGATLMDHSRTGSVLDLDLSGRKASISDSKIAFGSKTSRVPETGRKSHKQSGLTNRSLLSQTPQNENSSDNAGTSLIDSISNFDVIQTLAGQSDTTRPRPPASATTPAVTTGIPHNTAYSRQQSEPVTQEDFYDITNGLKEKPLAFQQPHPPREPSSDRVRRRPRIKSLGLTKGDVISPPTSGHMVSRGGAFQSVVNTTGSASTGLRSDDARNRNGNRESSRSPDMPQIKSPKQGECLNLIENSNYSANDSMTDVILLLAEKDAVSTGRSEGQGHYDTSSRRDRFESEHKQFVVKDLSKLEYEDKKEDEDSNVSTSASEGSLPGEYEESDDEMSGDKNKLHLFASPPKSASFRKNMSPNSVDEDQLQKSSLKVLRSHAKRFGTSSNRGARLEDDFVTHSDDPSDILHHQQRFVGSSGSQGFQHYSSQNGHQNDHNSGYHSIQSTDSSNLTARNYSATKSKQVPKVSASPDQRPVFDPKLYSDQTDEVGVGRSSVSRMSKKSLREINNPLTEGAVSSLQASDRPYDNTRYQAAEVTDSFEAGMLATMAREAEDELENVQGDQVDQPSPGLQQKHTAADVAVLNLYSESPATTSDDDTSFSTWRAPAPNQMLHNYQDEMKSRRSSDTLTSSNPRDWSGVMSPPVGIVSNEQNLEGTMEGILDDLSDDVVGCSRKHLSNGEEEDKLDLLFDPKLNCYYEPKSKKWYELVS